MGFFSDMIKEVVREELRTEIGTQQNEEINQEAEVEVVAPKQEAETVAPTQEAEAAVPTQEADMRDYIKKAMREEFNWQNTHQTAVEVPQVSVEESIGELSGMIKKGDN